MSYGLINRQIHLQDLAGTVSIEYSNGAKYAVHVD